jgi:hypothetical protein
MLGLVLGDFEDLGTWQPLEQIESALDRNTYTGLISSLHSITLGDDADGSQALRISCTGHAKDLLICKVVARVHDRPKTHLSTSND